MVHYLAIILPLFLKGGIYLDSYTLKYVQLYRFKTIGLKPLITSGYWRGSIFCPLFPVGNGQGLD